MESGDKVAERYRTFVIIGIVMACAVFAYCGMAFFMKSAGLSYVREYPDFLRPALYFVSSINVFLIMIFRSFFYKTKDRISQEQALQSLGSMSIVIFSFCEIPAAAGFLFFILSGSLFDLFLLAGFSLVLFILFFPRLSEWRRYVSSHQALEN